MQSKAGVVRQGVWLAWGWEALESRRLLSAAPLIETIKAEPHVDYLKHAASRTAIVEGLTPQQVRHAYGFDDVAATGDAAPADGRGQTIAIVTAFHDPTIVSDLHTFDAQFGLPDPSMTVVSQKGGSVNGMPTDSGWAGETALDVQWSHAVAPAANILVVEAKSDSLPDLLQAVDTARSTKGVSVVSMSWGTDEFWGQSYYNKYFTTPAGHQGVTFVAASGDSGSWWGPSWPATSANVLSVGGTSLNLTSSGKYASETGWNDSGGGESWYTREPTYQAGAQRTGWRTCPDVAYNADPYTGFATYNSSDGGWSVVGGTSAGTPQWAGLVALANQRRTDAGQGSLDGASQTLPSLYNTYRSRSAYNKAFRDVTSGSSSWTIRAHGGYDGVTGLGSPRAPGVVDALSGSSGTTAATAANRRTPRKARAQSVRRVLHDHADQDQPTSGTTPSPATTPAVPPTTVAPAVAPRLAPIAVRASVDVTAGALQLAMGAVLTPSKVNVAAGRTDVAPLFSVQPIARAVIAAVTPGSAMSGEQAEIRHTLAGDTSGVATALGIRAARAVTALRLYDIARIDPLSLLGDSISFFTSENLSMAEAAGAAPAAPEASPRRALWVTGAVVAADLWLTGYVVGRRVRQRRAHAWALSQSPAALQ